MFTKRTFSKYSKTVAPGEVHGAFKGDSPCHVDTKGYMDIKRQVQRMNQAGIVLESYRKGFSDSEEPDVDRDVPRNLRHDYMPSIDMPLMEAELLQKAAVAARTQANSSADVNMAKNGDASVGNSQASGEPSTADSGSVNPKASE